MIRSPNLLRRGLVGMAALVGSAAMAAPNALPAGELPAAVRTALNRAQLPADALVAYITELGPPGPPRGVPRLTHRAQQPVNPASLMKLYTTGAALELLGPAWTWPTPVLTTGQLVDGVLQGDLIIQGRGDPTLVIERLWLLLREVRQRGIHEVRGDIVLDGSAFVLNGADAGDPADFDGERFRPYNVRPDALLLNHKSITLRFVPEPSRGVARVSTDVNLAGVQIDTAVPLVSGGCGDWRGSLKPAFDEPGRIRLTGLYPVSCGEKTWPVAYAEPSSYNVRLIAESWHELGGQLAGSVRNGPTPHGALPLFEATSPPLAAVVRDINKFSNNVMAQQLFLSLGLIPSGALPMPAAAAIPTAGDTSTSPTPAGSTADAARELLRAQVRTRAGCPDAEFSIDNGSGLSRQSRSSARCLGAWLQALWASPVMPELMSSLPLTGIDGTARRPGRDWGAALGRAHLKTGSLRDSMGLAGYVLGQSGRRYAFVAIVNHPSAGAARPVLDALVQWAADDAER
ncbi:D-alanyl-D-alanine carboxypeptidase [Methylibium sp.]|uniref:D-alanyl-D-alanine carboxypeptidase/D-alanyl-D-alanine-endopeptidase n=1 Tax=Methylibium sp. TaxID=2067992 RepID=UPI00334071D9